MIRNEVHRNIQLAKRAFFIKGFRQGSRSFWRNIKNCSGVGRLKNSVNPWLYSSHSLTVTPAIKLNEHFINSILRLVDSYSLGTQPTKVSPMPSNSTSSGQFTFGIITSDDVRRAIRDLSSTESHSDDHVTSKMLRLSCDNICHVFASIFNISIQECVFPDCWKTAIFVPVHKKGDMHNYRPISLLNLFGKVFEKIICSLVLDHLKNSSVLLQAQHGFRKRRSYETALTRLTNLLFTA